MATQKSAARKTAKAAKAPRAAKGKVSRAEFDQLQGTVNNVVNKLAGHGLRIVTDATPLNGVTRQPANLLGRSDPVAISNAAQGGHSVIDGSLKKQPRGNGARIATNLPPQRRQKRLSPAKKQAKKK
jgi:hypothetical protein